VTVRTLERFWNAAVPTNGTPANAINGG